MTLLETYRGGWALVTGAGDGIGRAIARTLAAQGMKLIVADIRAEPAETLVEELRANGTEARTCVVDVSDRTALMEAAETLNNVDALPRILWINAGVAAGASVLEASQRAVDWVYGVNLFGAIWTAQAFVPLMRKLSGPRHVGVTASSAAYQSPPAPFTLYAASKHATLAIGEALRSELAGEDIGVTLFCPGLLNTNIWNAGRARPDRFGGAREIPHAAGERWREAIGPEPLMTGLMETVAAGGGYFAPFTEPASRDGFETRVAAMRAAIRLVGA